MLNKLISFVLGGLLVFGLWLIVSGIVDIIMGTRPEIGECISRHSAKGQKGWEMKSNIFRVIDVGAEDILVELSHNKYYKDTLGKKYIRSRFVIVDCKTGE